MNQDLVLKNQSRAFVAMTIPKRPIVRKEPQSEILVLIRMTVTDQLVGRGNPPPLGIQPDKENGAWSIQLHPSRLQGKTSTQMQHVPK